jgi:DNA-binding transcriptional regulator PaaX
MNERTRSQLFGVFLAAPRVTAPQLIALAAPLGISASNVKSHLSRLVAEGVVRRQGARRLAVYSLTERQAPLVEGINLRLAVPSAAPWDGAMLMLAVRLPARREARLTLRAALWFDGFRPWGRETWLRPAWPLPWARERALAFVSSAGAVALQGTFVGTAAGGALKALYASERLDQGAASLASVVERACGRVREPARAFAARLTLAGRVVNTIARDPRLPPDLSKGDGLARLRRAYQLLMTETEAPARRFVDGVLNARGS